MFTRLRGLWFRGEPIDTLWPQRRVPAARRRAVAPRRPARRLRRREGVFQRGAARPDENRAFFPGRRSSDSPRTSTSSSFDRPPRRRPRGVGGGARARPSDRAPAPARGQPRRPDADHRRRPRARRHLRRVLVPRPVARRTALTVYEIEQTVPSTSRSCGGRSRRGLSVCARTATWTRSGSSHPGPRRRSRTPRGRGRSARTRGRCCRGSGRRRSRR